MSCRVMQYTIQYPEISKILQTTLISNNKFESMKLYVFCRHGHGSVPMARGWVCEGICTRENPYAAPAKLLSRFCGNCFPIPGFHDDRGVFNNLRSLTALICIAIGKMFCYRVFEMLCAIIYCLAFTQYVFSIMKFNICFLV